MSPANRSGIGRLPAESTSFVGRRRLLTEVKAAFANTRLLTLVGPGGVGKTRLALRAAADLRRTVSDGAWFIDLAGLEDPHLVPKAVIASLGLADKSGQWPTSLLVSHLASREALLVLDNCEHLLDAIAVLAAGAGARCGPFADDRTQGADREVERPFRPTHWRQPGGSAEAADPDGHHRLESRSVERPGGSCSAPTCRVPFRLWARCRRSSC